MGPGPLPGPGGDLRRVDLVQPAQGGRQARLLAGRAVRLGAARTYKHTHGFQPNIPLKLTSPAGHALTGEGAVARPGDGQGLPGHLRHVPAAERGVHLRTWRASSRWTSGWSRSGCGRASRTRDRATGRPRRGSRRAPAPGLLATFNGGFKLDSAGGGFYLNGAQQGRPGERGGVGRLLPQRHHQDRLLGPRAADDPERGRRQAESQAAGRPRDASRPRWTRT